MHPWSALVGVSGTPLALMERLQRDIVAPQASPEVLVMAERTGLQITPSTQALRERVAADIALLAPLIAEGRIARLQAAAHRHQKHLRCCAVPRW